MAGWALETYATSLRGSLPKWQPLRLAATQWLAGRRKDRLPLREANSQRGSHFDWRPLGVAASSTQPLKVTATTTGSHSERLPLELADTRNGCLSKRQPLPVVQRVGTLDV